MIMFEWRDNAEAHQPLQPRFLVIISPVKLPYENRFFYNKILFVYFAETKVYDVRTYFYRLN